MITSLEHHLVRTKLSTTLVGDGFLSSLAQTTRQTKPGIGDHHYRLNNDLHQIRKVTMTIMFIQTERKDIPN